jgi:hypothetical protein
MSWAACCASKQMQDMVFGQSNSSMYRDAAKGRREASCQVRIFPCRLVCMFPLRCERLRRVVGAQSDDKGQGEREESGGEEEVEEGANGCLRDHALAACGRNGRETSLLNKQSLC